MRCDDSQQTENPFLVDREWDMKIFDVVQDLDRVGENEILKAAGAY